MTIMLNNGATHSAVWCGASDGVFHAELNDANDIPAIASEFSDTDATARITEFAELAPSAQTIYEGYTDLLGVRKDRYTGTITVTLQKYRPIGD